MDQSIAVTLEQLTTPVKPTWCPGCGNFGIWMALKNALVKLGIPHENIVIVYGVGCHANMRDWMHVYGVEGLHGRSIPVAQGIKLANPKLTVIAVAGDGDCLGEGGNHFIHAAKRNPDITVILHDNNVYGLTTGQASPTAKKGFVTKSTPEGVADEPVNPISLALVTGASFIARGFAGEMANLTDLFVRAITHKGFSLVDVLQPCVTFDKVHTYDWYRKRVYTMESVSQSISEAFSKAMEWGDRIPTGIFWSQDRPTSEDLETALDGKNLLVQTSGIPDRDGVLASYR